MASEPRKRIPPQLELDRKEKMIEALNRYTSCTMKIPHDTWKGWQRRCNTAWPMRTEFVALAVGDFTTSKDTMAKRIKRLEDVKDHSSCTFVEHPQTVPETAGGTSPLFTTTIRPSRLFTHTEEVERSKACHSHIQRQTSLNVAAPTPHPPPLGKVEVRVTVNEFQQVTRSTQLQHPYTIPPCLLTVALIPGRTLQDTFIVLQSDFWEFHDNTRFKFSADGELVEEQCDECVSGAKPCEGEGEGKELSGCVFNFPYRKFRLGGSIFARKTIIQTVRLRPKSIILNEILFRTDTLLNNNPGVIEALEITFFFESWQAQLRKDGLPRLEDILRRVPPPAEVYASKNPPQVTMEDSGMVQHENQEASNASAAAYPNTHPLNNGGVGPHSPASLEETRVGSHPLTRPQISPWSQSHISGSPKSVAARYRPYPSPNYRHVNASVTFTSAPQHQATTSTLVPLLRPFDMAGDAPRYNELEGTIPPPLPPAPKPAHRYLGWASTTPAHSVMIHHRA